MYRTHENFSKISTQWFLIFPVSGISLLKDVGLGDPSSALSQKDECVEKRSDAKPVTPRFFPGNPSKNFTVHYANSLINFDT